MLLLDKGCMAFVFIFAKLADGLVIIFIDWHKIIYRCHPAHAYPMRLTGQMCLETRMGYASPRLCFILLSDSVNSAIRMKMARVKLILY